VEIRGERIGRLFLQLLESNEVEVGVPKQQFLQLHVYLMRKAGRGDKAVGKMTQTRAKKMVSAWIGVLQYLARARSEGNRLEREEGIPQTRNGL